MSQVIRIGPIINPALFVQTLTGNVGGPVPPTAGNIDVIGSGNIFVTGNPGLSELTITLVGTTDHAVQIGNASGSLTSIGVGTDGQVLIGATGGDPAFSTLTSSDGSIAFTPGPNSLDLVVDGGGTVVKTVTGNVGGAIVPVAGNINFLTANATPVFSGVTPTETLDFGLANLFLGTSGSITVGTSNVAYGFRAGEDIDSGNSNTFLGYFAGLNATTSSDCVAIGANSFIAASAGADNNIAIGSASLGFLAGAGTSNIAIGTASASAYTTTESNNIIIGNTGVIAENNTIRIGSVATRTFIDGIDGVNIGSVATVVTEAADQLGTAVITAGTGISVTPSANLITIASSGSVSQSFPTDSGTATPVGGVLNIDGDTHNITTTGSGNTVNVKLTGITQHSLQVGGASNALTQLGVATNGQLPIGNTGSDPVLSTISSGNNITVTNGAGSISVAVTGTTNHSIQLGNSSGSLTSLGVATNGQLPIGSTGVDPVLATITAGTGISVTNGAGSITIASSSAVAQSFPTDSGTATPSAGVLNIDGDTHNITTTGSGNTVNVKLTGITQHSLQVGGASNALTQLGVATNGQLPIGSTGADPVLANISSGNNITVTNGVGSISVAVTGTTNHSIQLGNASGSLTSLGVATNGQLPIGSTGADPVLATLTAGTNISITNGAGSITINSTAASSFTWSVITVNQTAAVSNGYFCNKAGTLALALPAASAVGDIIEVYNQNTALGIQFTQASGQQIFIGNTNSTSGATGTLTTSAVGDSLKMVCSAANTTWRVVSMIGNWTPA